MELNELEKILEERIKSVDSDYFTSSAEALEAISQAIEVLLRIKREKLLGSK